MSIKRVLIPDTTFDGDAIRTAFQCLLGVMAEDGHAGNAPELFGGAVEQQYAHAAVDQDDAINRLFERLHQDGRKITGRWHAQFALA